ncbi:cysteine proteinase [Pleomassaria siparia CBS 279.74]|uniref:ubiquitinyl hydrolase 1 n=1 Tax=Pleomassaria siparia CBS 279.74 TaxID=1314801 RepID=A0A6G1K4Q7_9PLEO|nr:cysteine proteinase [Pleomassaria siparia CBS 279.74]
MVSRPGKTAPRLLQDLLTYDPRFEERAGRNLLTSAPPHHDPTTKPTPAVPHRNCRHSFLTKSEQSHLARGGEEPTSSTVYKVACFCQICRWHLDLIVDFRNDDGKNQPCRSLSHEYTIHHFLFCEDSSSFANPFGQQNAPRSYEFYCSAPKCPARLQIHLQPPRFSDQDITILTDRGHLRRRLEAARQIAGERADTNMARPVDALDFLSTYLQDSLTPKQGKSRIPLMNRKFLKTFGKDCDHILKRLGFSNAVEFEEEEPVDVWFLPKPPAPSDPLLEGTTERSVVEDARYELNTLILRFPEHERIAVRHPGISAPPSMTDLQRALGCLDYSRKLGRETRNTNHEEDHPYYAGLGAVGDFSDALLTYAYTMQVLVDLINAPYYFECLQDIAIGRKSEELELTVLKLASTGQTNRHEVISAYKYLGIDPAHAPVLGDDHIVGIFRSRLLDIGPAAAEESRRQLRIIGNARGSDVIKQVATETIETYEQALAWLDLTRDQSDEFIGTMYAVKVDDNPSNKPAADKAVEIIAEARNSQRLRDFLKTGRMDDHVGMDTADAYALLGISDRAETLDLMVLQTKVDTMNDDSPGNHAKYQQAYELICTDQTLNHGHANDYTNGRSNQQYAEDETPVGLNNIGNTCYLNSVLQFLFTIKPLRETVLDPDNFVQDPTPEMLENKIVGRSLVSPEKLEKAQQFVHELRNLFKLMIEHPEYKIRPETKLAYLALADRTDSTETTITKSDSEDAAWLGNLDGMPIAGPMPPPRAELISKPDEHMTSLADSVMGDDDEKSMISLSHVDSAVDKPEPPSRSPPPIPPRAQAAAPSKPQVDSTAIKKIEHNAQQQDAAEIMNNIFDLLSCALIGHGELLRDGEQNDTIKQLFFSDLTTVRMVGAAETRNSAIQDNHLISPGNRDRPLYAALDDEFSLTELDNDSSKHPTTKTRKFEYIERASPIQIINVRRLLYENKQAVKDESHVGLDDVLYLDRYLKQTDSKSEKQLMALREKQWALQDKLKETEARKKQLTETELSLTLPNAVTETAVFLEDISKVSEDQLIDVEDGPTVDPSVPTLMREHARALQKEAEDLEQTMKDLDAQINTIFDDCKDHPYRLHSVFMHRGTASGGHYWIYIYDFKEQKWRKYNDERVSDEKRETIFEHETNSPRATSTGIVYVREDLASQLTEAVCRRLNRAPLIAPPEASALMTLPPTPPPEMEVEEQHIAMKDADGMQFTDVQIINGIEKEYGEAVIWDCSKIL